jgi:hypothetical protein
LGLSSNTKRFSVTDASSNRSLLSTRVNPSVTSYVGFAKSPKSLADAEVIRPYRR